MRKKIIICAAGGALAVALAGGVAIAAGDDDDTNQTGPDADRAIAAALVATGGGKANSVELDDEDGATWEVEVTKPDGTTVDVRLDDGFEVVVIEGDSEEPDSDDAEG